MVCNCLDMVGPEPANLAAPRVLSSFGGNNTWCRREGPKIRRSWKIFLTGSLIGAGVGVLMALNSSRSGRETLREEVASETPLGMGGLEFPDKFGLWPSQ